MNILHAASSYPLHTGDATAPFMEEMLTALSARGHDIRIVVPRVKGLVEGDRNGLRVVGAPYAPPPFQVWGYGRSLNAKNRLRISSLLSTPAALGSMFFTVRREIRRLRPDVVHLHWLLPQGALVDAVSHEVPVVISLHGADARFAHGALKPVVQRVIRRAGAVVAASSPILSSVADAAPHLTSKCHVVPHGANSEVFAPADRSEARRSLGLGNEPVVLAIGRLVPKKGFYNLIEAIGHLDGVRLVIVGEGPDRSRLQEAVLHFASGRVELLGSLGRRDVARWMAASEVIAAPGIPDQGDVDSGPVVIMEALAMGRPVVATRIGMAIDVIEHGVNGYIVEVPRSELLAAALAKALENVDALSVGARERFVQVGDWARVAEQLERIYLELL